MRFERSKNRHPDWASLFQSREALRAPEGLHHTIVFGEHPITSWLYHEELSPFDPKLSEKFKMAERDFIRVQSEEDQFLRLGADNLLAYCEKISVHPAHLVPLNDDPRLSLPRVILDANIRIIKDDSFSKAEKALAHAALVVENARYHKLMNDKKFQTTENIGSLVEMFRQAKENKLDDGASNVLAEMTQWQKSHFFNQDGVRDIASLMIEEMVSTRDIQNFVNRQMRDGYQQQLNELDDDVSCIYRDIFEGIEGDRVDTREKNLNMHILRKLRKSVEPLESVDPAQILSMIKSYKRSEIALIEKSILNNPISVDASQSFFLESLNDLSVKITNRINLIGRKNKSETSYKADMDRYEQDIATLQSAQVSIRNEKMSYIERLFANQYVLAQEKITPLAKQAMNNLKSEIG
jgi:hypothetical protein